MYVYIYIYICTPIYLYMCMHQIFTQRQEPSGAGAPRGICVNSLQSYTTCVHFAQEVLTVFIPAFSLFNISLYNDLLIY